MHGQNLWIWVSIDCYNVVCNFLPWPLPPPAGERGGGSPRRTSITAVGVVLIAPVIPKQAIHCNLLSSAWRVLSLTLAHHTVAA
jgi:hypothetical protein